MPAASITSFRLRGSLTSTRTSTSNSPAPRRRRGGKPDGGNLKQDTARPGGGWGRGGFFRRWRPRRGRPPLKRDEPLDRLVQPLVIERAAHGRELLAKFLGRRRRDVGVVCVL